MDYLLILGFVLLESWLLYEYCRNKKKVTLIVFIILIVLFCAGRPVIPNIKNCDAMYYNRFYERAFNKKFGMYMKEMGGYEFLFYGFFWICAKFKLSYWIVRTLYYLIMTFVSIIFIKNSDLEASRYSDYWFIITNFVLSFCLMRNTLAYVIGWISISYCLKRKYLKSILFAAIGTLIHNTCIVIFAFIFFMFAIDFIKRFYVMLFCVISSYAIVIYIFPILLLSLGQTNDKIAYYLDASTNGSFALLTNITRFLILLMLLALYKRKARFRNDLQYKNIILLVLFSFSIIFAQLVNGVAYRFLAYFNIINIVSFSYLRKNRSDFVIKIGRIDIKNIMAVLINCIWLIMFLQRDLLGYGLIPIFE